MKKQIRYSIEKLTSAGHGQNINFLFKSFLTARDALDNENKRDTGTVHEINKKFTL